MSNVIEFRPVNGAYASGCTTLGQSIPELRVTAWANYYRGERDAGACPNLAGQRADEHVKHFDKIVDVVSKIMAEG